MTDTGTVIRELRTEYPDASTGLSGQQLLVCEDLLHLPTVVDVAKKHNVTTRTIYYWLKDSRFSVYLAQRESDLMQEAARRMIRLVNDATIKLDEALRGEIELSPTERFAVETITKRAPRLLDQSIVLTRLADLQSKLDLLSRG